MSTAIFKSYHPVDDPSLARRLLSGLGMNKNENMTFASIDFNALALVTGGQAAPAQAQAAPLAGEEMSPGMSMESWKFMGDKQNLKDNAPRSMGYPPGVYSCFFDKNAGRPRCFNQPLPMQTK